MTDIKNRAVFISGPMTGIDNYNVAAFCEAHARLKALSPMRVYNPAIEYLQNREDMPHKLWMRRCLVELLLGSNGYRYDVLISLPGWQNSEGARLECAVANACGIEVVALSDLLGE